MAKTNDSKNEVKKLQKEIAALKNKLKVAEKHSFSSEKNWQKKEILSQKEAEKKLASAYQAGYQEALSESERKESARKKALLAAEASFEKDFRRASKTKAAKGKSRTTTKPAAKQTKTAKSRIVAKTVKTEKASKPAKPAKNAKKAVKTTSARANAKKRGRPSKSQQKQERMKGMEGQQFTHHDDMSSKNENINHSHESELV